MIKSIIDFDYKILLAINGLHTPFWDAVMNFSSSVKVWIPLYVLIAILIFFPSVYGKNSQIHNYSGISKITRGIITICALFLCFGLCDQIADILRDTVQRLRPRHDPILSGMLHLSQNKWGLYGFVSAHAANTFGFALLTTLIFKRKLYGVLIFLWAALIGFSRIYLGDHFLTDVICGALIGIIISIGIYYLWRYVLKLINRHNLKKCSAT